MDEPEHQISCRLGLISHAEGNAGRLLSLNSCLFWLLVVLRRGCLVLRGVTKCERR